MNADLLAIGCAFLYAVSYVFTRIALRHSSTREAVAVSLFTCVGLATVLLLVNHSVGHLFNSAAWLFLAAGIIGPFFGRFFVFEGIDRVGVAITTTFFEVKPLFAVIPAVLFLGEGLTVWTACGVVLMIAGTAAVSLETSGGQIEKRWSRINLIYPIAGGACYGVSHVLRKIGVTISPDLAAALFIQNIGALFFTPLLFLHRRQSTAPQVARNRKKSWPLYILCGGLQIGAQWMLLAALERGSLVVVSPLSSLQTFFVYILAALFLRSYEKVTWKIVFGGVLIIAATILLTIS